MAAPTIIPIRCDRNSHTGPLGICKTTLVRSTELEVIYRRRSGVYNPMDAHSFIIEPPSYLDRAGVKHYMEWCSACVDWHRREAFYPDKTRRNGLRGVCRTADNVARVDRRRRHNQALRNAA